MSEALDEILLKSHLYVTSLDRSILGGFAVDLKRLRTYDALQSSLELLSNGELDEDDRIALKRYVAESRERDSRSRPVIAEWMLWNERSTGRPTLRSTPKQVYNVLAKLRKIADNPECHDYFAVGIWNVQRAKQYAESSIDPEMALRLEPEA